MALKENRRILLTVKSGRIEILTGRGDLHDFEIVQDATRPKLLITLKDEDGNVIDMTSGSATFSMIKWKTASLKINGASMSIDSGSDGEISYDWSGANDTSEAGVFLGRITATQQGDNAQPIVELIKIKVKRKFPTS